MHFCGDELIALTTALPFIGGLVAVFRRAHFHWFRRVWESYAFLYEECRCKTRRARAKVQLRCAPVACWWLDGREEPVRSLPVRNGTDEQARSVRALECR